MDWALGSGFVLLQGDCGCVRGMVYWNGWSHGILAFCCVARGSFHLYTTTFVRVNGHGYGGDQDWISHAAALLHSFCNF